MDPILVWHHRRAIAIFALFSAVITGCEKSAPKLAVTTPANNAPGGVMPDAGTIRLSQALSADALAVITGAKSLPVSFKQLGLFSGPGVQQPMPELVPFGVKVSLWSDGLDKQRFLYLPAGKTVAYEPGSGRLLFPNGTIAVKHFSRGDQPVETRVITRQSNGSWKMAAYQWTSATEATRVDTPMLTDAATTGGTSYRIPSPDECQLCHTPQSAMIFGFQPDQLHGAVNAAPEALTKADGTAAAFFTPELSAAVAAAPSRTDPNDASLPLDLRARAYLDLNCGSCHNPNGTQSFLDLSFAGLNAAYPDALLKFQRIVPGQPEQSVIWQKFAADKNRMPPTSLIPDPLGLSLIKQWILSWPVAAKP